MVRWGLTSQGGGVGVSKAATQSGVRVVSTPFDRAVDSLTAERNGVRVIMLNAPDDERVHRLIGQVDVALNPRR